MAIEEFLGIPYQLNGRDRSGTDCLGLVIQYLWSIGRTPPDGDGQPIDADWRREAEPRIMAWLSQHTHRVTVPAPGDIAVFRLPGGTMHLGVMADAATILHILEDRPSMLTSLRRVGRRLVGVYRLH